jgi:dTMP kinase
MDRHGFDGKVLMTREPGGSAFSESIRALLLNPANHIQPMAELFLYEASRAQLMAELIIPSLERGKVVLCDRFTDSTLAYQSYGRGIDKTIVEQLNKAATCNVTPGLTILLDIAADIGLGRARKLQKEGFIGDRIEQETLAFHKKVRLGFRALAKKYPRRIAVVDAMQDIETVHGKIIKLVEKRFR